MNCSLAPGGAADSGDIEWTLWDCFCSAVSQGQQQTLYPRLENKTLYSQVAQRCLDLTEFISEMSSFLFLFSDCSCGAF